MNIETANRLVELRRAHGYSQEDLAAKLGVSRQAVSKWERAESSPDTDNLIALARLYGVSLDGLLLHQAQTGSAGGAAYAAAPEPEPEPEPQAQRAWTQEDEDAQVFATAAAWDAADQAVSQRRRMKVKEFLRRFPLPILVTPIYLCLGFFFGLWHPGWLIFLAVPLYYGIVDMI